MEQTTVKLSSIISPGLYDVHKTVKSGKCTHYWLKGGRGSTKSSYASIAVVKGIMENPNTHAVVIRKVAANIGDSVFEQIGWAIDMMGVSHLWDAKQSPHKYIYIPTGQTILFRGADKPKKIKSTKVKKGYIRYVWYEEVDEFTGPEEIRTINQSLMRGGPKYDTFYSYNPPRSGANWVNNEVKIQGVRKDVFVHHSCYLDVPVDWLGEQFIIEAQALKESNPTRYNHEYMGEVTGTGGEIFLNVELKTITDDMIQDFYDRDQVRSGNDWGYSIDPLHYTLLAYDRKRKSIYIFGEIHKTRLSNAKAAGMIKDLLKELKINDETLLITCDSSEPKSIADYKEHHLWAKPCKKYPGSVEVGMKFLIDEIEHIYIDSDRCPDTAREFMNYELELDAHGEPKAGYPDKDNHSIDAVRYALDNDIKKGGVKLG